MKPTSDQTASDSARNEPRIEPRTLKGFRDTTPEQMIAKEAMLDTIRRVFRSFGFVPIDTPALEYTEILLGKGGGETDKQLYRFTDHGGRDVALRFDLTVPFARFAAQYGRQLGTPFKRYHIGPVWRGENTARGRFREFWQCDFDTIGTTSPLADLETALVIDHLLAGLGIERFQIRLADRGLLSGLLDELGLADRTGAVLRALDKLEKVGEEAVARELEAQAGTSPEAARKIFDFARQSGEPGALLARLGARFAGHPGALAGGERLRTVIEGLRAAGVPEERFRIDLSLARGLDYYTGTIFETVLLDEPEVGSVCSGGRYDNLASVYTKDVLPGVGASLGIDRLLDALSRIGGAATGAATAHVIVTVLDRARWVDYVQIAEELRAAGIPAELYLDERKLDRQLQYANRKGIRVAVIAGESELDRGQVAIKDLQSGSQSDGIPRRELAARVAALVGEPKTAKRGEG
ncbi:MAG TPA: histidine--tRNA ligase [Candidatus Udaeobacter sp.]|nr:histidine--tRNA ligase [Candidatus Udaeobacter sp.]